MVGQAESNNFFKVGINTKRILHECLFNELRK